MFGTVQRLGRGSDDLIGDARTTWRTSAYHATRPVVIAGGVLLAIGAGHATAQPLVVNGGNNLVLSSFDPPHETEGVLVGGLGSNGTLVLEAGAEWTNVGGYYLIGSGWEPAYGFLVGFDPDFTGGPGIGYVTFEASSTFNNTGRVEIGWDANTLGFVTLEAGAIWNSVGRPSTFDFNVRHGELIVRGELDTGEAMVGSSHNAIARVQGPGGVWYAAAMDVVAVNGGSAAMHVTGGGSVYSSTVTIGGGSNSPETGHVTVGQLGDSLTSTWTAPNMLIGPFDGSQGTLTVTERGRVNLSLLGMTLGFAGGEGHVVVENGGAITVATSFNPNFRSTVELFAGSTIDVANDGRIIIGGGGFEPNLYSSNTIHVGNTGLLKGTGTVIGNVRVFGSGRLNPGHSVGMLTIVGDLIVEAGGVLTIEIGPGGQHDKLDITGNLTLGGTLELAFIDGYAPTEGDFQLNLFQGDFTLDGNFDSLSVTGLADGYFVFADLDALASGQLSFSIDVPEPASLVILTLGSAVLLVRRTR
jgi:hypothetical protein